MIDGNRLKKWHYWKNRLLGVIYPPRCVLCDGIMEQEDAAYEGLRGGPVLGKGIHWSCCRRLSLVAAPVCMHCGRPIANEEVEYCYDCARAKKEQCYRQGKALFVYEKQMRGMMYRFKYSGRQEYAAFFALYARERYGTWLKNIDVEVIIPVPMYYKKKRKRGYNQAEAFARWLSVLLGVPCRTDIVHRIVDTQPMKELNDIQRKNNLKKAFQIRNCGVKYNRILVVDDIYTTGATADAVAGILGEAVADTVYFLAVCIGKGY